MLKRLWLRYGRLSLARQVFGTFLTRILVTGIGMATTIVTARLLGPTGRGILASGMTVVAIGVQFGNLGLPQAATFFAARNREMLPALTGNALVVSFGLGAVIGLLTWAVCTLWPSLAPVPGLLLTLTALWIPFQLASSLMNALLLGLGRIAWYNTFELLSRTLILATLLVLYACDRLSVGFAYAAVLLSNLPFLLWAGVIVIRDLPTAPITSRKVFMRSLDYAYKVYVGSVASYLMLNFDLLMVDHICGHKVAGLYSVSSVLGNASLMLTQAMTQTLFPSLSLLRTFKEKWQLARKAAVLNGVTTLAVAAMSIPLAGPVVERLLGAEYAPATVAYFWQIPGVVCLAVSSVISVALAAAEHPPLLVVFAPMILAFNVVLNLYLIPSMGIIGASISWSLTCLIMLTQNYAYLRYYICYHAESMELRE